MRIHVRRIVHPDARELIEQVQQEYVVRYGEPDATTVSADQFDPPQGLFAVGYGSAAVPVASGGWRYMPQLSGQVATYEIKRMFVTPAMRGRGYARTMLAYLEDAAAAAGAQRLVLETGRRQPEAMALYRSCGYRPTIRFGHYADYPLSVYLAKSVTAPGAKPAAAQTNLILDGATAQGATVQSRPEAETLTPDAGERP
ncbi:MAG: GNAT family N-acetyltransferase [Micrococcales bacterium]|nr:MAG: GNAT family N-acetyltransferase [Micrococcales bacterium]